MSSNIQTETGVSNVCNTLRTNTDTAYLPSHIKEAIGIKLNIRACLHLKTAASTATAVGAERLSEFQISVFSLKMPKSILL